jgi:hypothetical protein
MRIRLVVRTNGAGTAWHREVERPYAGVPRRDDWVYLGENDVGGGVLLTRVGAITWENDGSVSLRCDVATGDPNLESSLETLGFAKRT